MPGFNELFIKLRRYLSRKWEDLVDFIPIQKPTKYKRSKSSRGSKRKKKEYKDDYEYIRNIHHIPFYKKFKQLLAFTLLGFNVIFSQFLLGSRTEGQIMFVLFLGNSFILADYLWKMRKQADD